MWRIVFMALKPTYEELERRLGELEKEAERARIAGDALRKNERLLSEMIQGSPIPTFMMNLDHTITYCNKAFENLIGVSADQILGSKEWLEAAATARPYMADFIVDQAPEEEMVWYYGRKCRKSGLIEGAYEAEGFFPEMGAKGKWLSITAAPLWDGEGKLMGALETLQDITEMRETEEALRESEKRLSQIVHGTSIPTFVINDKHTMIYCNRAFENLTGIRAGQIVGTGAQWMAFYGSERPVMADLIVDGASENDIKRVYGDKIRKSRVIDGAYEVEDFFPDLGNGGKWLFFTAAPLMDDEKNINGAIETLQDVTERRRAEEALRESEKRYRTLLDFAPYPIVVFTLDGKVSYLNPAFTEVFGWTLDELEGRLIPYVPPGLEQETSQGIKRLFENKVILREEAKRMTKDGRLLDVIVRAVVFSVSQEEPSGELVILRDVTQEKRIARNNEAMLRISMALPEYPDLEDLLYYVNSEVKSLLGAEGSITVLHDEIREDLFILGAAYDDRDTAKRAMEIRFSMNQLVAGQVIQTGEPMIVNDTSSNRRMHEERDKKLGYRTRNLVLVPLKSSDRIIGALCAINKKESHFDQTDVEMLSMIAGTVALSVENARFSDELKKAYREVTSLNRAKDKVINHLSHELRTPVAILSGSLNILTRRLSALPEESWKPTLQRLQRNLDRVVEIQYQVQDIMENKTYRTKGLLTSMIDECGDEIETLLAEELGEQDIIQKIRKRIDEIFSVKEAVSRELRLDQEVPSRLDELRPLYAHRQLDMVSHLEPTPPIFLPPEVLQKVIDGLVKNAIENTPDEGRIELLVRQKNEGAELVVHDFGVGITEDAQRRIFEGFFTTRDTMAYSSKRPFDFNAGGKGADLLRMKIFAEKYNFTIGMVSARCRFLPKETDVCPGRISQCPSCSGMETCHASGGTIFTIFFPPAALTKQRAENP